jgi:hypothetical protein
MLGKTITQQEIGLLQAAEALSLLPPAPARLLLRGNNCANKMTLAIRVQIRTVWRFADSRVQHP